MARSIQKQFFYTGLLLAVLSCLLWPVFPFFIGFLTHLVPGWAFGLVLSQLSKPLYPKGNYVLFNCVTTVIYICGAVFVNVFHDNAVWTPIKLVIASSFGSLLTSIAFDVAITLKWRTATEYAKVFILGLLASIISAASFHYMFKSTLSNATDPFPLFAGAFSIFPLWFTFIGQHLLKGRVQPTSAF